MLRHSWWSEETGSSPSCKPGPISESTRSPNTGAESSILPRPDVVSLPCGHSCPNFYPVGSGRDPGAPCVCQLPSTSLLPPEWPFQSPSGPEDLSPLHFDQTGQTWWWDLRISMETAPIFRSGAQLRLLPVHSPRPWLPHPFLLLISSKFIDFLPKREGQNTPFLWPAPLFTCFS